MNFNDDLWDATSDMQPPLKQQWENWAKSCSNITNVNAVIKIARSFMQRSFSEYNQDDYALNCANGVIDLKTGEIQEHKPEFYITQKTNVNVDRCTLSKTQMGKHTYPFLTLPAFTNQN